jgi:hypothetical protein
MKSILRNIVISVRAGYRSPWIDEGGCSRETLHHSILLWLRLPVLRYSSITNLLAFHSE